MTGTAGQLMVFRRSTRRLFRSGAVAWVASALLTFVGEIGAARADNSPSAIVSACAQGAPPSALAGPGPTVGPLGKGGNAIEVDRDKQVFSHVNWAMNLLRTRNYDRALEEFEQAIKLDPRSSVALFGRAQVYLHTQKYDLAIKDADLAIELFPANAAAYLVRGVAYARKQDYGRAIESLDQAIKLDPVCSVGFLHRADAYGGKSDYAPAVADFDRAIELTPTSANVVNILTARGLNYAFKGDYDRAIADSIARSSSTRHPQTSSAFWQGEA
jgi:tetratricopeptide (TPR) repeat protein